MSAYLPEIKTLSKQLASIETPMTEAMKVFSALRGLGRDYKPIKTIFESAMILIIFQHLNPLSLTLFLSTIIFRGITLEMNTRLPLLDDIGIHVKDKRIKKVIVREASVSCICILID